MTHVGPPVGAAREDRLHERSPQRTIAKRGKDPCGVPNDKPEEGHETEVAEKHCLEKDEDALAG